MYGQLVRKKERRGGKENKIEQTEKGRKEREAIRNRQPLISRDLKRPMNAQQTQVFIFFAESWRHCRYPMSCSLTVLNLKIWLILYALFSDFWCWVCGSDGSKQLEVWKFLLCEFWLGHGCDNGLLLGGRNLRYTNTLTDGEFTLHG